MDDDHLQEWKESLIKMITSTNIDGGIDVMLSRISDEELLSELLLLKSSFSDSKKMIKLGLVTQEEWSVRNNRITHRLLNIISSISGESIDTKTIKANNGVIPIKNALEWLSAFLKSSGHVQNTQNGSYSDTEVYSYPECTLNQIDGTFKIIKKCENWVTDQGVLWNKSEEEVILGKFKDISEVFIEFEEKEVNENENTITIHVYSFNRERLFKRIEIEDSKEKVMNHFVFHLYVRDLTSAERIKNAFDYISYYYGREEEAF